MGRQGNSAHELVRKLAEVYISLRSVNSRDLGCGYDQHERETKISKKQLEGDLRNRDSAMPDADLMIEGIIEEIQIMRLAVKYNVFDRERTVAERNGYRVLLENLVSRYNLDPRTFLPREQ